MSNVSATDSSGQPVSLIQNSGSFLAKFGPRKVAKSIVKTAKGLRDWVSKAPNKKIKAFRIVVLMGIAAGTVCLGMAVVKAAPWVLAGGALLGGGYLIYRGTRPNPA